MEHTTGPAANSHLVGTCVDGQVLVDGYLAGCERNRLRCGEHTGVESDGSAVTGVSNYLAQTARAAVGGGSDDAVSADLVIFGV